MTTTLNPERDETVSPPPWAIGVAAALIFLQACVVPALPVLNGLDPSFQYVLNRLAMDGARFGVDVIYTYGPLGFLNYPRDVGGNLAPGYAWWIGAYALFSVSLAALVGRTLTGWRFAAGAALAIFAAPWIDSQRLFTSLVVVWLLLRVRVPEWGVPLLLASAVMTGTVSLVKTPYGVACASALAMGCLFPFTPRRAAARLFLVGATVLATVAVWWVGLYGTLEGLAGYVSGSLEIARGYSAIMARSLANEESAFRWLAVSVGALLALWLLGPREAWLPVALIFAGPLLIGWKHGVVRFDRTHFSALLAMLMLATVAFSLFALRRRSLVVVMPLGFIVLATVNAAMIRVNIATDNQKWFPLFAQYKGFQAFKPLVELARFDHFRERLAVESKESLRERVFSPEITQLIGDATVDVYDEELSFVAANDLRYHPKPVFQHFNAFTPSLDRMNADFFASANRPEFLIFFLPRNGVMGVDDRYFLHDDSLTHLEVLRHYQLAMIDKENPEIVAMRSGPGRVGGEPEEVGRVRVNWREVVKTPEVGESHLLRVRVKPSVSTRGRIRSALLRLNPIHAAYLLADGTERRFRLIPHHMENGMWVNPFFGDGDDFRRFLAGAPLKGPAAKGIRFEDDGLGQYEPELELIWERVAIRTDGYDKRPVERVVLESK